MFPITWPQEILRCYGVTVIEHAWSLEPFRSTLDLNTKSTTTACVTLEKLLKLPELPFPHMKNGL